MIRTLQRENGHSGRLAPEPPLNTAEVQAVQLLVHRILDEIRADLVQAALFGSKARGQARAGSDIDVLLVFEWLPMDREPFAGDAEAIAEEVAGETGIPVTVWSVSLIDLMAGNRTPMLVDALEDSLPIWCRGNPLPQVEFTPGDALRCAEALLQRLAEGSADFSRAMSRADWPRAARRARDDIVRACTALALLRGITRPRRAEAILFALEHEFGSEGLDRLHADVLHWAAASFGPDGRDENLIIGPPPATAMQVAQVIELLRQRILDRVGRIIDAPLPSHLVTFSS